MGNLNDTQLKKIQSSKSLKTRFESMQLFKVDRKNIHQVLKNSEETVASVILDILQHDSENLESVLNHYYLLGIPWVSGNI